MPGFSLKQKALEVRAKVFRRRSSTPDQRLPDQRPPVDSSSSSSRHKRRSTATTAATELCRKSPSIKSLASSRFSKTSHRSRWLRSRDGVAGARGAAVAVEGEGNGDRERSGGGAGGFGRAGMYSVGRQMDGDAPIGRALGVAADRKQQNMVIQPARSPLLLLLPPPPPPPAAVVVADRASRPAAAAAVPPTAALTPPPPPPPPLPPPGAPRETIEHHHRRHHLLLHHHHQQQQHLLHHVNQLHANCSPKSAGVVSSAKLDPPPASPNPTATAASATSPEPSAPTHPAATTTTSTSSTSTSTSLTSASSTSTSTAPTTPITSPATATTVTTNSACQTAPLPLQTTAPSFTPVRYNSHTSCPSPSPATQQQIIEHRPSQVVRRQSILPISQSKLIQDLYYDSPEEGDVAGGARSSRGFHSLSYVPPPMAANTRKVWVKRSGHISSPTAVTVTDEDMVDDVRDLILGKLHHSLGTVFDAPDIDLWLIPRQSRASKDDRKLLRPDEMLLRVLEEFYPGGQTMDDALVIDTPHLHHHHQQQQQQQQQQRPSPRPSPNHSQSYPGQQPNGGPDDYFTQKIGSGGQGTPVGGTQPSQCQPSINLASPRNHISGSPGRNSHRPQMPRRGITSTTSPTQAAPLVLTPKGGARNRINSDGASGGQPTPAPTVNPAEPDDAHPSSQKTSIPIPQRVGSPPVVTIAPKKKEKPLPTPSGNIRTTDSTVPPIKVLIVEDNVINLRLLEAFMKRLKVRWEAAMNGKVAVDKWRAGGFHLILMDIQLPVMNGLDATKEIRRLEKANHIGSFAHLDGGEKEDGGNNGAKGEVLEQDRLPKSILFRSPVIIVALTASSLQSDRHEAYAAGCNDFLTKPVNFIWLERKVTEWGCMQALIDFDGWKTWKRSAEDMAAADAAKLAIAKGGKQVSGGRKGKKL